MSDDRQKLYQRTIISDDYLDGGEDSAMIVRESIIASLDALTHTARVAGNEVDWTTLDLRVFRDTSLDTMKRDPYLTVRAGALTKKEN